MVAVMATRHTSAVEGAQPKLVNRSFRGTNYAYILKHKGFGQGSALYGFNTKGSKDKAYRQADSALQRALKKGCNPGSCPRFACSQRLKRDACHGEGGMTELAGVR